MPNPIPDRFRRALLAVCDLYLATYMSQHGASQDIAQTNLDVALRPLAVSYRDLTSGRTLYRVRESSTETGPNKPHSQWLDTMDRVTRRWAHDVFDPNHHFNDSVLVDVNAERHAVGLAPLTAREIWK